MKKIHIAAAALALLLILVFLSGSIYNFNKPLVTAALPIRANLNHREVTGGIVRYGEMVELYADMAGWVYRMLVREGDQVVPGQPLIEFDFRTGPQDAKDRIENIQAQIQNAQAQFNERMENLRIDQAANQIELERISADIQSFQRQIRDLQNMERTCLDFLNILRQKEELHSEEFSPDPASEFELRQNKIDIEEAERNVNQLRILFNAGIASRQELEAAENSLESAFRRGELLNLQADNRLADWETSQETRLRDLNHQMETRLRERNTSLVSLENQLDARLRDQRARNLNIESDRIREETMGRELAVSLEDKNSQIAEYERRLAVYESRKIVSDVTGVVTSLSVNQGQHINANQLLATIGLTYSFVVECEIPLSNNFVSPGDRARLRNTSGTMDGVVTQIVPLDHAKRVTISIESDRVSAGETFTVTFEERSREPFILVPNTAINRDGQGYFVNQIRRRRGILGDEFYTQRLNVIIGDSDDQNTAILQGIVMFAPAPIVVNSERPFAQGQSIRLRNEDDFFEN